MSLRHSAAIARNDLRMVRRDPTQLVIFTAMPLVAMAFVKPAFRADLVLQGVKGANGAEQAVPGMAVMFAFFLVGNVGLYLFSEHGWNTWDRLRTTEASTAQILIGKTVTPFLVIAVQLSVLFGVGAPLYGLRVEGQPLALVPVAIALAICLIALGYLLFAISKTLLQLNTLATLGAIVLAGLGGAMTPLSVLPRWARAVAPATPGYWAMRGFRGVILDGAGFRGVAPSVAALLALAVVFGLLAMVRFNASEAKLGTT